MTMFNFPFNFPSTSGFKSLDTTSTRPSSRLLNAVCAKRYAPMEHYATAKMEPGKMQSSRLDLDYDITSKSITGAATPCLVLLFQACHGTSACKSSDTIYTTPVSYLTISTMASHPGSLSRSERSGNRDSRIALRQPPYTSTSRSSLVNRRNTFPMRLCAHSESKSSNTKNWSMARG